MWLVLVLVWLGLLIVVAAFALQAFGYDFAHISAVLSSLPPAQRYATTAILVMALLLIGASLFQAYRLSRQDKSLKTLRDRLKNTREDVIVAHALQNHLDATVQHLIESDPREAVSSLDKKLTEIEQRAVLQQGRNQSTDMHDQLANIRRRQQGLREMVGKVAAERRAIEPVFTEIKDRQHQIERALTDIETDDKKNNLADRLKELDRDASALLARVNTVQESFATLNRFKEELVKSQAELVPLRAPESGINALIGELRLSRDALAKTLDEVESSGDDALSTRVEALSRNKLEIEQRIARVEDSFNILDAIRLDFEELKQRQARLERSLADVETDANGKSLIERQNALNEFVIDSRLRLGAVQDSFTTLTRFKEELSKSHADLIPLQAPVFGIEALIGEVHAVRDLLVRTVEEIEQSGDKALGARVEALSKSKREIEGRLTQIFENFTTLDALRKDIGGIFTTIRNTLNRIG
jgi:membrane protein implicated in regulation of membrane protease activity